ncbi:MAG: DNA-directed RNA polymerase subunit alpha [Methanomicrobia archaeon]|nr:DNA-directed RNA polymerase subunit alpha [Methanomicrobia archaeon]
MQNIALPKKIEFKTGSNPNEGLITVEPLFPGYGMTLGNSLRRVLLSSLPGAAVIGAKIKGASHEFMALPHVKEDVLEIILNLKQIRLKVYTEEEVRLELKVKGKKTVTAGDIAKNSQVEVKNPDLVLAHVTDENGSLEMEIVVKEGRGYKMPEGTKKENREIGYIEIDSLFSPVTLVSISVENTRVGKMTNWDKLNLDIKTDGTITPEEAFNESVKVLVNQYSALLPGAMAEAVEVAGTPEVETSLKTEEVEETGEQPAEKKEKKEAKETKKKAKK